MFGRRLRPPGRGSWLENSGEHGIYYKGPDKSWWIASPCCDVSGEAYGNWALMVEGGPAYIRDACVCDFYALGLREHIDAACMPVRPVVCIPTSVFNNNYTLKDE